MDFIKLSDVTVFVRNGASIKQNKSCNEGIPITRIETISNNIFNYDKLGYAAILNDKYSEFYLEDNDVLLSHINSSKFVGRSVIYKKYDENPIIHGMNLLNIRFIQEKYNPEFFVWYTKTIQAKMYFKENTKHAVNQASMTSTAVKNMPVPNIDLEQQNLIALNLNRVYSAILTKKKLLLRFDELIKSRFIEMFGDPILNEKGWIKEIISRHINVQGGYAFKSNEFIEEGVPVLRIGNINSGKFKPSNLVYWCKDSKLKNYEVYPGDLVLSLTGTAGKDDYGNICVMDNSFDLYYLNQRNAKLIINNSYNSYFLKELFSNRDIKNILIGANHGVRQGNILNKDILNLCVIVPPIELQNKFADFVQQIDKSKFIYYSRYFLCEILTFVSSTIAYSSVVSIFECPNIF